MQSSEQQDNERSLKSDTFSHGTETESESDGNNYQTSCFILCLNDLTDDYDLNSYKLQHKDTSKEHVMAIIKSLLVFRQQTVSKSTWSVEGARSKCEVSKGFCCLLERVATYNET